MEFGAHNFPDGAAMQDRGLIDGRGRAPSRKIAAGRFSVKTHVNRFAGDRGLRAEADLSAMDSTAVYLAHMTDELAKLARCAGLDLLSYLLDMAKLEAMTCAHGNSRAPAAQRGPTGAAGGRSKAARGKAPSPQKGFQVDVGVNFR
jgi:hypothetical protein